MLTRNRLGARVGGFATNGKPRKRLRAKARPGWAKRKAEVRERSGGVCEVLSEEGERCRWRAVDAHHVIARSKFGKARRAEADALSNLADVCRAHHRQAERAYRFGRLEFAALFDDGWATVVTYAADKFEARARQATA